VPPELLARVLDTVQQHLGIAAGAEVTMEADPGTFDLPRLLRYKELGISRLSMGVQSFQQVRLCHLHWQGCRVLWCCRSSAEKG
jgi:coproporphyrinogen III oxidase-like Fe-S oxidoreductase